MPLLLLAGILPVCLAQVNSPLWLRSQVLTEYEGKAHSKGQWTFNVLGIGTAQWSDGARAQLQIRSITADSVTLVRTDTQQSGTKGLTAIYTGKLTGDVVEGEVVWSWPGHWPAPIHGHWFASANPDSLSSLLSLPDSASASASVPLNQPVSHSSAPAKAPAMYLKRPDSQQQVALGKKFVAPTGFAIDLNGDFLIADDGNHEDPTTRGLFKVKAKSGETSLVYGPKDTGLVHDVEFPANVAVGRSGDVFFIKGATLRMIMQISGKDGEVSRFAGMGMQEAARNTSKSFPGYSSYIHIDVDHASQLLADSQGDVFIVGDGISKISTLDRKVVPVMGYIPASLVNHIAVPENGTGVNPGEWDGQSIPATRYILSNEAKGSSDWDHFSAANDMAGNIFIVADIQNRRRCIAKVSATTGTMACLPITYKALVDAGASPTPGPPTGGLAADNKGNVFFYEDKKIWKYAISSNQLSLVAAMPESCINRPLAVDSHGTLYALCDQYIQHFALTQ